MNEITISGNVTADPVLRYGRQSPRPRHSADVRMSSRRTVAGCSAPLQLIMSATAMRAEEGQPLVKP
jgi:hypothetical protein